MDGGVCDWRAARVEYAAADDGAGGLREDVEDEAVDGVEVLYVRRTVPGVIVAAPAQIHVDEEVVAGESVAVDDDGVAASQITY